MAQNNTPQKVVVTLRNPTRGQEQTQVRGVDSDGVVTMIRELVREVKQIEKHDNIDDKMALLLAARGFQLGANAILLNGDDGLELYIISSDGIKAIYWDDEEELEKDDEWSAKIRDAEVLLAIKNCYETLALALRL